MQKRFFIFLIFGILCIGGCAQNSDTGLHAQQGESATPDTNYIAKLLDSAYDQFFSNPDPGLALATKTWELTKKMKFEMGESWALNVIGEGLHFKGDYPGALKMQFQALQINQRINDLQDEVRTRGYIGIVYLELGQGKQALAYMLPGEKISRQIPGGMESTFELSNIGEAYRLLKMPDSALYYQQNAYKQLSDVTNPHLKSFVARHLGTSYAELGKNDSALKYYRQAIEYAESSNDYANTSLTQKFMADLYVSAHQYDSAIYYARMAFTVAQLSHSSQQTLLASDLLASLYKQRHQSDSIIFYQDIAAAMRDTLYGPEKTRQIQLLMLEQQEQQQSVLQDQEQFRNKIKYIALLSVLAVFLLLAFILLRNNRQKQKINELLREQKSKVEKALTELKSTQAQLIQREKMASLGELTAGIAHEIQNPLNFVNNFSELNKELLQELQEEEIKKERDPGAVSQLLSSIDQNLDKIAHHGKRADAIIKGMLQHSRGSTGIRELTDINVLADEYLRLSYQGIKAKDPAFEATLLKDFDPAIHKINMIPRDFGQALLNIYNNAFYAVAEKKKSAGDGYQATVSVSTRLASGRVELLVRDNGNGIPSGNVDKIFQPFFTTKPTGQGTGLGLSLSYDIIKAQGGTLTVNTKPGVFTEFTITPNGEPVVGIG